jgi:hypothetical protein
VWSTYRKRTVHSEECEADAGYFAAEQKSQGEVSNGWLSVNPRLEIYEMNRALYVYALEPIICACACAIHVHLIEL